jgi:ppGpp synthetase/RelA/SpoT-type nucleotidyltranferase
MTEDEFLERWQREERLYAAWGRYVAHELRSAIATRVAPTKLELFLKLPVQPRVKETESLLQKAYHRKKAYTDPYEQIEDKVGLRFVVLVEDDVRTIEEEIESGAAWIAQKARDFAEEREKRPYEFDYQSLHYVLRSRDELTFEGERILANMSCEVQVRTLLQHAYSELTHDTIYKPSVTATPALKRAAAKSMALIEATDGFFSEVSRTISGMLASDRALATFLAERYSQFIGNEGVAGPLNSLLIDHYKQFAGDHVHRDLEMWLSRKPFLGRLIQERATSSSLYRVPAILLVYYAVGTSPTMALQDSPLDDNELEPIYSDLGEGIYG